MRPVYCTREQVKTALDSVETARNNRRIDRLNASSADYVERLTLRKFYPQVGTRTLDWIPELDSPESWRLWLGENELAGQPTAVTSGGASVVLGNVYARPDTGPPYDHLEINRGGSAAWSSAASSQRAISITGTFGYQVDDVAASSLAAGINSSTSTVTIGASWEIGVGSLLLVGSERMQVTNRSMSTTGQTLQVLMSADQSSTAVAVTTGSAFTEDEVIMLDGEKMRVDEITGNTLRVTRKWDGTPLAAHTGGVTVYAQRQLTVERGVCGTTPASHLLGDTVSVFRPPPLINQLAIAKTIVNLLDESSGFARTVGSGDNEREAAGRRFVELEKRVQTGFYRVRVS